MMQTTIVDFGEGIRVFYQGKHIESLVLSVNTEREKVELIQLSNSSEVEFKAGINNPISAS